MNECWMRERGRVVKGGEGVYDSGEVWLATCLGGGREVGLSGVGKGEGGWELPKCMTWSGSDLRRFNLKKDEGTIVRSSVGKASQSKSLLLLT